MTESSSQSVDVFTRWTQLRGQGQLVAARELVRKALTDPNSTQQAMACMAIDYCSNGHWGHAVLPLLQACMEPAEWSYHALLARSLIQLGRNDLAVSFLQYGLRRQPDNSQLRAMYWQAAAKVLPKAQLLHEARVFLSEATDVSEQKQLLSFLGQAPAQAQALQQPVGQIPVQNTVVSGATLAATSKTPVDILVPVFGGYQHTRRCLESLIQTQPQNLTPSIIIVLDDAGQDQILSAYLKQLAEAGQIQLHRHAQNLGFIENINYGMRLNLTHDVVWVNSDTQVHGNWLDRLKSNAESQPKVASVTPWSNNGELLSFTESQIKAPMPSALALASIDQTIAQLALKTIEIPGGCGFCFYIRREAINDVGYLNGVDLKRGYGEETEWSMRAREKGWVHLAAIDTFVAHEGGNSFGLEKALRVYQNNGWIRQAYPDIDDWFKNHSGKQDLNAARHAIQTARLPELVGWAQEHTAKLEVIPEFLAKLFSAKDDSKPAIRLIYSVKPEGLGIVLEAPLTTGWCITFELPAQLNALQTIFEALKPVLGQMRVYEPVGQLPVELQALVATQAQTQVQSPKVIPIKSIDIKHLAGRAWLIADPLKDPALLKQWLSLAHQFGQQNASTNARQTLLCFLEPGDHAHALRATGAAYQLPRLEGLPIHEQMKLTNIHGAITLVQQSEQSIYQYGLASDCMLSLTLINSPNEQTNLI